MDQLIGFEGIYTINRQGVIKNRNNHTMSIYHNKDGYPVISLTKNKKHKVYRVHRLLAIQYLCNPNNYNEIDHIDRNKKNNSLDNLRWCSRVDNCQNMGLQKDNKTGHSNIHFSKYENKFIYKKRFNKKIHKKRFNTLEEAIAYKESITKSYTCGTHLDGTNMNTIIMK